MRQTVYVMQQLSGVLAPEGWSARTCLEIGLMMKAYLRANPSPPGAEFASEFEQWAENLVALGQARQEEQVQPPRLSLVPSSRP